MHQFNRFPPPDGWWTFICAVVICICACPTTRADDTHVHEHPSSEFEVFVAGVGLAGSGQPHARDDDSWIDVDVIFGLTRDQFRVFGEYFFTPEEHDLERFQMGYEIVPDTVLWLGRFHQPASAWNTEHHHGRYLQTAITRPAIENWEDEEGVIPQHITGLLLESRLPMGASNGLLLWTGVGAAPAIEEHEYEPITLVGNNPGKHGMSYTGRLAYLPDYTGTSSAGLLYGHDQLFVRNPYALATLRSNHVGLDVYGAYADWSNKDWRFIGVTYYVDVKLDNPTPDESFVSGYLQVERQLPHGLTVFARFENSAHMHNSRYVAMFDDHSGDIDITVRREAAGMRWDYARRQALTTELSHVDSLNQRAYEIRLQWSAAIP